MKRRNEKKKLKQLYSEAPKIRCRYCDVKDSCTRRPRKEAMENDGVTTRCLITPNRLGKNKKRSKKISPKPKK